MIAEHFAVEDVKVFRNMFELMDTNGDGKIAFEELKAGLIKAGSLLGETEMKMLMNSVSTFSGIGHKLRREMWIYMINKERWIEW